MQLDKTNTYLKSAILAMLSLLPIIDSINGIAVRTFGNGISYIYKMLILVILLRIIVQRKNERKKLDRECAVILLAVVYVIFSVLMNFMMVGELSRDVMFAIKLIYNLITFGGIYHLVTAKYLSRENLYQLIENNTILFIIVIYLPKIFGLGYYQYAGEIGYKGFYYSNNEFNTILTILFLFQVVTSLQYYKKEKMLKVLALTGILLMQGSKSSVATLAIAIVMAAIYIIKKYKHQRNEAIMYISTILVIGITMVIGASGGFLRRQLSLFSTYAGSVISLITSGRDKYVIEVLEGMAGQSYLGMKLFIGNGFNLTILTEMDYVDLFFGLGLLGLLIALVMTYKLLIGVYKRCVFAEFIFILTIVINSFFAGHILFMSTSSPYWIIVFIYYYSNKNSAQISYE